MQKIYIGDYLEYKDTYKIIASFHILGCLSEVNFSLSNYRTVCNT